MNTSTVNSVQRSLSRLLYGVGALDPATFLASSAVLVSVALLESPHGCALGAPNTRD